jgi:ABC-type multidrug transport system, ATPase and permease components
LDDALASVDNQTATAILQNLPKGKTVLFISHNLSVASHADHILLMDQGKIVAEGSHQELLRSSPKYQKLWQQHQLEEVLK